jgi:hypothetical protein
MLAVFDIGNAYVSAGVFQGDRLRTAFRLAQALSRFPVLAEITQLLDAS